MSDNSNKWVKEISLLRSLAMQVNLQEEIKWGKCCYTYNHKNIVMIQPFKDYCSLGFFNGALLNDKQQLLVKAGEHTQFGRQMRFNHFKEITKQKAVILSYLEEAIDLEKNGIKSKSTNQKPTIHIEELADIFRADPKFKKSFEALTIGRQRGYLIFFSAAKQSETRKKRIQNCIGKIKGGKGLHDCTCGLSKKMPSCDGSHKALR